MVSVSPDLQQILNGLGVDIDALPSEMLPQIAAAFSLDSTKTHSPQEAPQPTVCLTLAEIVRLQQQMTDNSMS